MNYKKLALCALLLPLSQTAVYASEDAISSVIITPQEGNATSDINNDKAAYNIGYGFGQGIAVGGVRGIIYLTKALAPIVISSVAVNFLLHSLDVAYVKKAPTTSLIIGCFVLGYGYRLLSVKNESSTKNKTKSSDRETTTSPI